MMDMQNFAARTAGLHLLLKPYCTFKKLAIASGMTVPRNPASKLCRRGSVSHCCACPSQLCGVQSAQSDAQ